MDSDGRLNGGYQRWLHQTAQEEQSGIVQEHRYVDMLLHIFAPVLYLRIVLTLFSVCMLA